MTNMGTTNYTTSNNGAAADLELNAVQRVVREAINGLFNRWLSGAKLRQIDALLSELRELRAERDAAAHLAHAQSLTVAKGVPMRVAGALMRRGITLSEALAMSDADIVGKLDGVGYAGVKYLASLRARVQAGGMADVASEMGGLYARIKRNRLSMDNAAVRDDADTQREIEQAPPVMDADAPVPLEHPVDGSQVFFDTGTSQPRRA